MAKKQIKVNALAFHLVLEKLNALEENKYAFKIRGKKISNFLTEFSDFEISTASLSVEVKIAILKTKGFDNPDPEKLPETRKMKEFGFTDIQYLKLTKRFNSIAKSHNQSAKSISAAATQACETVKACIDLVSKASATVDFFKNVKL